MRRRVGIKVTEEGHVRCGLETDDVQVEGTSLVGVLKDVPYEGLVETFGSPNGQADNYKSDVEWHIETPEGLATIYNYKNGKAYLGEKGRPTHEITQWMIGGHTAGVVSHVKKALGVYLI